MKETKKEVPQMNDTITFWSEFAFWALHDAYQIRGDSLVIGQEVVLSLWGEQHLPKLKGREGVVVGHGRASGILRVKLTGNKIPTNYWSGFFKKK